MLQSASIDEFIPIISILTINLQNDTEKVSSKSKIVYDSFIRSIYVRINPQDKIQYEGNEGRKTGKTSEELFLLMKKACLTNGFYKD